MAETPSSRIFKVLDDIRRDVAKIDTAIALLHHESKAKDNEIAELKEEVKSARADLRVLQDDRTISKGYKALGAAIVTVLGAVGGIFGNIFFK